MAQANAGYGWHAAPFGDVAKPMWDVLSGDGAQGGIALEATQEGEQLGRDQSGHFDVGIVPRAVDDNGVRIELAASVRASSTASPKSGSLVPMTISAGTLV